MALIHCEEMFDQRSGEVAFLKLYGELLLEKSEGEQGHTQSQEEEEGRDLGMQLLEEAVVVFEQELKQVQQDALAGKVQWVGGQVGRWGDGYLQCRLKSE